MIDSSGDMNRLNPDWHTLHTSWLQLYDGVIYIEESTPTLGLH